MGERLLFNTRARKKGGTRLEYEINSRIEVEEDEDIEYDAEEIIDSDTRKWKVVYRIRWEGYGPDNDTWKPFGGSSCRDKLKELHGCKGKGDS